ncbi:TetR/AcrR family transcriptional regulator C-terminal domain-containing protein [Arthrobacter monumenti]
MASTDRTEVWLRATNKGSGPAPAHSLHSIGAAGVQLADAGGMADVSMRKVAAAIGAGVASLYRYVASHDELLEVMIDRVGGEYHLVPSADPAVEQLVDLALQGRSIMHRHPWLPPLLLTRPSLGPNSLRYLEHALGVLAGVEMPEPRRLEAVASLTAITSAYAQNELSAVPVSATPTDPSGDSHLVAALSSGRYPMLSRAFLEVPSAHETPGERFIAMIRRQLHGEGI